MFVLPRTFETSVFEGDDDTIVIRQDYDGNEEHVSLSVEQAALVAREMLRLVEFANDKRTAIEETEQKGFHYA